ncbi:hypothetical protein M413DRAFT_446728 [Hebeloma cylindrosporum]|uniref:Store-operated calcium entry-associated regulatory factor n=1 Tax=Hebeloma cylindrosporum TaxID=76867 RepID=A0A0C3C6C6_HEBCY|nr:hypothetical protein M413DRAFT_446728 [Hebeloma cylindrosporum h7]
MSRVELAKIPSLLFYQDAQTAARRTSALPQLVCVGKPCKLFQPEVVRCVNLGGGYGTDVDWKCEADLPDSLRFGKVEVSCEGWSKPGDPYVLKGSCSLEYRLIQVPGSLRDGSTDSPIFNPKSYDWSSIMFNILWIGVLIFLLYSLFQSCFRNNTTPRAPRSSGPNPRPDSGSGWFPGYHSDDTSAPPPPYSKTTQHSTGEGWRPGFWTGAALGGLANHIWNRPRSEPVRTASYDWERHRQPEPQPRMPFFGGGGGSYRPAPNEDRGEGSSNLGSMRRSTGIGGSKVR